MTGLLNLLPRAVMGLFFLYLGCKGADFILGILKTWKNKNTYESRIMRDGIVRWIGELVGIVFVIALDIFLGMNYVLIKATLGLFVYKEAGSILENLKQCGVELPPIIAERLKALKPEEVIKEVD